MRIENVKKIGAIALMSVILVACKSTDDTANDSSNTMPVTNTPAATTTTPANTMSAAERQAMANKEKALAMTVFYFEFDKSDLSAEAREALVYHAEELKANPSRRVRLEGHADERGTREYNLALGERRAQAVQGYLQVQGVASRQLEVISYGEERPANTGNSETAYSRNRRVELK